MIKHESTFKKPEIQPNIQEQKINIKLENNLEENIKGFNNIKKDINKSKEPISQFEFLSKKI